MTKVENLSSELLEGVSLYSYAGELGILLFKDFIHIEGKNEFYTFDGEFIDDVQHVFDNNGKKVGFYFTEGYKTVRCYLEPTSKTMSGKLRYLKMLCFNIGFINKDANFEYLKMFVDVLSKKYYDSQMYKVDRNTLNYILTKGIEMDYEDPKYDYMIRKYYFTEDLTADEKKDIALRNNGKFRIEKSRKKLISAIDNLMLYKDFIKYSDIAKESGLSLRHLNRIMNQNDKDIIRGHNKSTVGQPTHNEYLRAESENEIEKAYIRLKNKGKKINIKNLSEQSKVYRSTVSKIMKDPEFVELLNSIV